MKRWWSLAAAVTSVAMLMAACGDDSGGDSNGSSTTDDDGSVPGEGVTVGMALPGPQNDKGFNEAHYNGIILAEQELGITPNVQENVADPEARIDALRNLAADNDLVIGVGAEFAEAGLTVAPQFEDVQFVVINGEPDPEIENLHIYGVRQGVPAYVAGVVIASEEFAAESGADITSVGYIGGEEIPPTTQSDDGFRAGVEDTNPDVEYASTIVGDFNDAPAANEAAVAQLDAGAQAIFGLVDAGFPGVIQAAEDAGGEAYLFSVIFPRCEDYPNIVGTAFLNSDILVESIVQDYLDDDLVTEPFFYGVEDPEIQRLELCPDFATPELEQLVDDTQAGITDGDIELPDGV